MKYTTIQRGTGVTQEVYGTGFEPGETVTATVYSTPFDLEPQVADAAGNVTFAFAVDADFDLGAHRVEVTGSESGALPMDRETTDFTVTAPALPATGGGGDGLLIGGLGIGAILAGAALYVLRRKKATI
ncbi:LPXTG cell wall anchor domain-containing protein [Microbacterium sp. SSW1-59]|uniref:LPXTG cell wall anchor domain-containing protein n=1 Tax=Microbacterium xanthum TaxID=3079794 RepID=UPI002AD538BA|nr:LPXTG cell wall anchor domain-containing protein [Microbacterium sp. SSW1-59]MDZ8201359.1 LPXTG cell wall anchor domain-containing protein [Microbacterium sp. SSW1-59]